MLDRKYLIYFVMKIYLFFGLSLGFSFWFDIFHFLQFVLVH